MGLLGHEAVSAPWRPHGLPRDLLPEGGRRSAGALRFLRPDHHAGQRRPARDLPAEVERQGLRRSGYRVGAGQHVAPSGPARSIWGRAPAEEQIARDPLAAKVLDFLKSNLHIDDLRKLAIDLGFDLAGLPVENPSTLALEVVRFQRAAWPGARAGAGPEGALAGAGGGGCSGAQVGRVESTAAA